MSSACSERGWPLESCSGLGVRVEVRVAGLQWSSVKPRPSRPLVSLRGGAGQWDLAFRPRSESTVGPFRSWNATFLAALYTAPTRTEGNLTALNEMSIV